MKTKTELKTFKIELLKQLLKSLTWYKNETDVLKEQCKSKDLNSNQRTNERTNSNQPNKEPPLRDIKSELSSNSDEIQEEVTESSNFN